MAFLATYWWVFLAGAGVFVGIAAVLQIRNMSSLVSGAKSMLSDSDDVGETVNGVFAGVFARFKAVAFFGFLGSASGILGAIGVIVALIEYFQTNPPTP